MAANERTTAKDATPSVKKPTAQTRKTRRCRTVSASLARNGGSVTTPGAEEGVFAEGDGGSDAEGTGVEGGGGRRTCAPSSSGESLTVRVVLGVVEAAGPTPLSAGGRFSQGVPGDSISVGVTLGSGSGRGFGAASGGGGLEDGVKEGASLLMIG